MENEIIFDDDLLNQICIGLDGVISSDNELQMKIFNLFKEIQSTYPTFCFYLLHIISSDNFPLNRRFCALLVLNRNYYRITKELIPKFISIAKPLLEQIIRLPFSPFTSNSALLLCSMARFYGLENFPDFYEQISVLFSNQETIQIGLECLKEMADKTQKSEKIPDFLLQILPQLINSPFNKTVLDICYLLCSSDLNFIHDSILSSIFSSYTSFDEDTLAQASAISTITYLFFPDEVIANFLIGCLSIDSKQIRERILIELNNDKTFTPFPPFVEALLQLLEKPDEDATQYGPCSSSQQILQNGAKCYGIQIIQIVKTFISGHFPFINDLFQRINNGQHIDPTLNVGFLLRCLSTILPEMRSCFDGPEIENELQFYYTIIIASLNSPFRGDACDCLMNFCCSNEKSVTDSFHKISPLLADSDGNVQIQSLYALEHLVEFDQLEPNVEQFSFLVNLMKTTNEASIAHLAYRYATHFPILNDSDSYILNLYHELMEHFISTAIRAASMIENENLKKITFENIFGPIYQSLIDMLSLFITVVEEPFEMLDKRIFNSVLVALTNEYFDENIFSSYFELIKSLLTVYMPKIVIEINSDNMNFLNTIQLIFRKIIVLLVDEYDSSLLFVKDGYEIISKIISEIQQIKEKLVNDMSDETQSFVQTFINYSCDHFSLFNKNDSLNDFDEDDPKEIALTNFKLCCFIRDTMYPLIPRMNYDNAKLFLEKSYEILKTLFAQDESTTIDFKIFGLTLIELIASNNSPIDGKIYDFFMS